MGESSPDYIATVDAIVTAKPAKLIYEGLGLGKQSRRRGGTRPISSKCELGVLQYSKNATTTKNTLSDQEGRSRR